MYDADIRQLLRTHTIKDAVECPDTLVIDEFCIAENFARADIATLHAQCWQGYEIKGARDSFKRLPRQVIAYGWVFDHCHLVVEPRHVAKARAAVPAWWGLLVATPEGIACEREAQLNPDRRGYYIARTMWREEIQDAVFALTQDKRVRRKNRADLSRQLMNTQHPDTIREIATKALSSREFWRKAS